MLVSVSKYWCQLRISVDEIFGFPDRAVRETGLDRNPIFRYETESNSELKLVTNIPTNAASVHEHNAR